MALTRFKTHCVLIVECKGWEHVNAPTQLVQLVNLLELSGSVELKGHLHVYGYGDVPLRVAVHVVWKENLVRQRQVKCFACLVKSA